MSVLDGRMDGREHVLPVRIYYEDTDFTGLVYHGAYVRFFERGRSSFLRTAGVRHSELASSNDPMAFVIVRLEVDFRRAARIDDELEVRTAYEAVKGPRLMIGQRIMRGSETLCEAVVQAACIDLSGRARKPPPELVDKLTPYFRA